LKAKIAGCLTDISGIESVDILHSLRVIARSLLKENPRVKNYSAPQLLEYMEIASKETTTCLHLILIASWPSHNSGSRTPQQILGR